MRDIDPVYWISAEWVLKGRANGGGAVLARTILVALPIYALAVLLKAVLQPKAAMGFDFAESRRLVEATLPWLGTILAGVYAGLYSRFSAQWNYLADLYNQQFAASLSCAPDDKEAAKRLRMWQAGFIEDAEVLHLALKPMFASVIRVLLKKEEVRATYIAHTPGGAQRLQQLEERIDFVLDRYRDRIVR
jgi:hypothetical protein